jgi:hypothetical protein
VADGSVIAGTPQRVRAEIERQVRELGVNYLLTYMFLGRNVARRSAAFAGAVLDRGDAQARASVIGSWAGMGDWPRPPDCAKFPAER